MTSFSRKILTLGLVTVWIVGPASAERAGAVAAGPLPGFLDQVRQLIEEEQFGEAESLARELLSQTEAARGPTSIEVADVLDLLVETLWRSRKTQAPETRELAERALRIRETHLGPDDLSNAESLLNLAVVLEFTGNAAEAEPLYQRAIAIRERSLGPQAPEVGDALTYLANMYLNTTRFDAAEPLYERVLAIRESEYGPDHPRVARTLSNLANLLHQTGDYARSESYYRRALAIEEEAFGRDHIAVAWNLNGLAVVLREVGKYSEALLQYERALAIRKEALGPEHLYVVMTLNNIALLLRDMGDYARARSDFEHALTLAEDALGTDDTTVATLRSNLAELLRMMGERAEALRIHEEVLAIRMRVFGVDYAGVGATLSKIAAIHMELGQYAQAASTYERTLAIYEKSLGADHMEYGRTLGGLARARLATGQAEEARSYFIRSLSVLEQALGPDHPWVAQTLDDLGVLGLETEVSTETRSYLVRALAIREASLGPDHPLVGTTLSHLGEFHARSDDSAGALRLGLRAEELGRKHLRLTLRTLPERQALRYTVVRPSGLDLILSLAAGGLDAASTRQAWNALCRSRALVLDEMALRRGAFARAEDPAIARLETSFAAASRRLANVTLRGPGQLPPQRYHDLLNEARGQREVAEIALAEASKAFRQEQELEQVGLDQVVSALPTDTALVAFALFRDSYLAFVLDAEHSDPVAVSLGPADVIDASVAAWREEATHGLTRAGRSALEAEAAYREVGVVLRRSIWDPLASALDDAKRVLIVPDGAIHLVSFSALPDDRSGYLIETGPVMQLLSAERDVVSIVARTDQGNGLLALGGPAFDDATGRTDSPTRGAPRSSCTDLGSLRFPSLPASAREVKTITDLWIEAGKGLQPQERSAIRLIGSEASESRFKEQASGKRVLHLATHGFFLGERCASLLEAHRGIGGLAAAPGHEPAPSTAVENPLLLSGLALAGANHRTTAKVDEEDGILTAAEIATMDLRGVQWAVLSACDTGVGKVQAREGVLGLRRAFQVAGTGTVIMSLWPVGDVATARWMGALYEGRLIGGLGTAEAVREAGLASLRRQRQDDRVTHPFHWGAFVAAGDWR